MPDNARRSVSGGSGEWRGAALAEELLHLNDLPALCFDHLRREEPDVWLGRVGGGVLRHRQAAMVMAKHQLQEIDVERFARQCLELVYLGWSGHSGHETVGGQLSVAVHPSHYWLARRAREIPDVQPALHFPELEELLGFDIPSQDLDRRIAGVIP